MNYLWGGMILIGIIYGTVTGHLEKVSEAAIQSSKEAVSLCVVMAGVTALWVGMMRIAEKSGLLEAMEQRMQPVLNFLFPEIPGNHPSRKSIATNLLANVLGLGWAATPAGLKAMEELGKLEDERRAEESGSERGIHRQNENTACDLTERKEKNMDKRRSRVRKIDPARQSGTASNEMCTFLIVNISSLQLIPINMIAYRSQYGSVNPAAIAGPALLATIASTAAGVVFCKVMDRKKVDF